MVYTDSAGKVHRVTVRSKGSVILSAGTIGSPQLLLLSGVGPSPYLSSLNIPLVHHNPFVGQLMKDNPFLLVIVALPFIVPSSIHERVGITPDFYLLTFTNSNNQNQSSSNTTTTVAAFTAKLAKPLSTGSMTLVSPRDVRVSPKVRFNYLSNENDMATCIRALRKVGELFSSHSVDVCKITNEKGEREFRFVGAHFPFNQIDDDASMENLCRETLGTIWHYHGGCLVGKVVDEDFKVYGIEGLRVADNSALPVSPGTNPQATLMMIGR